MSSSRFSGAGHVPDRAFTQEDPIGIAGGLNLYGYANGDPINFSDPFGLNPVCNSIECLLGGILRGFGVRQNRIVEPNPEADQIMACARGVAVAGGAVAVELPTFKAILGLGRAVVTGGASIANSIWRGVRGAGMGPVGQSAMEGTAARAAAGGAAIAASGTQVADAATSPSSLAVSAAQTTDSNSLAGAVRSFLKGSVPGSTASAGASFAQRQCGG